MPQSFEPLARVYTAVLYCAKPEVYVAREKPCERLLEVEGPAAALGLRAQRLVGILPKAIARRCGTAAAP